jgi:hypothetical protein
MRTSRASERELAQYPETLAFALEKGRLFTANFISVIYVLEPVIFVLFFAVRGTRSRWFFKID